MPERRRRFDSDFKLEALRLADDPDRSDASIERDLGLFGGAIKDWGASNSEITVVMRSRDPDTRRRWRRKTASYVGSWMLLVRSATS